MSNVTCSVSPVVSHDTSSLDAQNASNAQLSAATPDLGLLDTVTKLEGAYINVLKKENMPSLVKTFEDAERLWYSFSRADCASSAGSYGGSGEGAAFPFAVGRRVPA